MTLVEAQLIELLLTPTFIAATLLFARRELWRGIVALSISSLVLEGANLVPYILQRARILPFSTTPVLIPIDILREVIGGLAFYGGMAAWILGLGLAAQTRRFGWFWLMVGFATISLASVLIEEHSATFFPANAHSVALVFLEVAGEHLVAAITFIYGLRARNPQSVALPQALPQPIASAPTTPEMPA